MTNTELYSPDYQAALQDAVFMVRPEQGFLRISGSDRLDFLNRQTTNDIYLLNPGRCITTVLTTPTARMQDVLTIMEDGGGDSFGAITLAGHAAATAQHLRGKIFFMDKVVVDDASDQVIQIDLDGPKARALLGKMGIDATPEPGAVSTTELAGSWLRTISHRGFSGPGYRLVALIETAETLKKALADVGFTPLSPDSSEILRIEAGLPASHAELSEANNPLEAGLDTAVSESKGCYTGQEIIARQITYDKVTKQLVGLRLDELVEPGGQVEVEGRTVGTVTSVADSPRFGPIALAYLKRPYDQSETQVLVVSLPALPIPARVTALPFT